MSRNPYFCCFMRKFLILLLVPLSLWSQERKKLLFTLNQCDLNEQNRFVPELQVVATPVCDCGLEFEALELQDQRISIQGVQDTLFYSDFSIGFSVLVEPGTGNIDLLSKMKSCNADTSLSIVYQHRDSTFVCSFQQGFDRIVQLVGKSDQSACWQQLAVVRSGGQFRLFINGQLKDEKNNGFIIRLNNKQPLTFNGSPCIFTGKTRGLIDQIFLANYAMNSVEVNEEILLQDQILTQDTLIFLGGSARFRSISDCATSVQWTPSTGLNADNVLNPVATPIKETRYVLKMQNVFCLATDTVLVRVVDTAKSDCNLLNLPTAFTPNDDQLNDRFFISNNYLIQTLQYFDILDRNGGIIYQINSPNDSWDGNWNGDKLNTGTYYYRIAYTCKGNIYKKTGSVFLLR